MASTILSRTISSVVDKRIVLSNSQFARAHGVATWTKLRVGLRAIMNNTGANITGTPRFYVGLGSGTTNMIMDATTDNWCGVATAGGTWTFNTAPTRYTITPCRATKRVGSTLTDAASQLTDFGSLQFSADATGALRILCFIDITKGSPNYTFRLFYPDSNPTVDALSADFLAQVPLASPAFTGHNTASAVTLAVDESTGTFTHVMIGWDQSSPTIEICDLAVVKLL